MLEEGTSVALLNIYSPLLPPKHPHLFLKAGNSLKTGWRWMLARARVKVTKMAAVTKKKMEATKNGTIMTTATTGMMTKATRKL